MFPCLCYERAQSFILLKSTTFPSFSFPLSFFRIKNRSSKHETPKENTHKQLNVPPY